MESDNELYCPECGCKLEFDESACICPLCIAIGGYCQCVNCSFKEECDCNCERDKK